MFQETKEGETHFCCEKCRKCPDYGDNHSEFCHDKKCRCHVPAEKWEEEFIRRFYPNNSVRKEVKILANDFLEEIKDFIRRAISEAVEQAKEGIRLGCDRRVEIAVINAVKEERERIKVDVG